MVTSGVYTITNLENSKVYVGFTVDLDKRWDGHKQSLRRGDHCNIHLQRAWNKYGEGSFEFDILEYLDSLEELPLAEQFWCKIYQLEGRELYNIATPGKAGMLGRKHTEESKRKMSEILIGNQRSLDYKHSEETRRRMSEALKGNQHTLGHSLSKEHRRKIGDAFRGKSLSKEHCDKISAALIGHGVSKEARRKIGEATKNRPNGMLGKKHSEETKRKISMANKGNQTWLGKNLSEEHKRSISKSLTGRILSEEHRRKISEGLRARHARVRSEA